VLIGSIDIIRFCNSTFKLPYLHIEVPCFETKFYLIWANERGSTRLTVHKYQKMLSAFITLHYNCPTYTLKYLALKTKFYLSWSRDGEVSYSCFETRNMTFFWSVKHPLWQLTFWQILLDLIYLLSPLHRGLVT